MRGSGRRGGCIEGRRVTCVRAVYIEGQMCVCASRMHREWCCVCELCASRSLRVSKLGASRVVAAGVNRLNEDMCATSESKTPL